MTFCRSAAGDVLVLSGEDTVLKVYDHESGRLLAQLHVFAEQPIHGIHVEQYGQLGTGTILLWGSRSVGIVSLLDLLGDERAPVVIFTRAPDWVYHGRLSPYDPSVAVLATAHNEVVYLRIDRDVGAVSVGDVVSPARPMLYSAELCWLDDASVLLVAGTAFGEILIWKCIFPENAGASSSHEMLLVLTGHEGSIYGVRISPLLTLPDKTPIRLLASCSDDRTVRIWDISERAQNKRAYDDDLLSAARETGFSAILPDQEQPSLGAVPPVAVAMGHLSRIWGVEFAVDEGDVLDDTGLYVYSFGEDSTTQKWHLTLDQVAGGLDIANLPLKGQLTNKKTFSYHDGKHLWSNAITTCGSRKLLATGGADGRISLLEEASQHSPTILDGPVTLNIPLLVKGPSNKAETLGRFELIAQDQMLAVTSLGRLLMGRFTSDDVEWKEIPESPHTEALKRCCVLRRLSEGMAVLCTSLGGLYLFRAQEERLTHVVDVPSKVVEVFFLRHEAERSEMELLVPLFGHKPLFYSLNPTTGEVLAQKELSCLDARFVTTSAAKIGEYLLVGSRHGYLSIMRENDHGLDLMIASPPQTPDSITSIVALPAEQRKNTHQSSSHILFLTTSRDGRYRIWRLEPQYATLQLLHDSSPPFGPLIEGAWFTNDASPELVLYGFKSKHIIVWNDTRKEERISTDCGGGHRAFSFYHGDSDARMMRIAFNRSSKLCVFSKPSVSHRPLRTGHHGREIRALSYNGRYVATGSEDTSIRLWEYRATDNFSGSALHCVASIKTHVVGIQALKWVGEDYLLSCAGNEEFFVWRIRRLGDSYSGLAVVCESVFKDKSPVGDLRIMDFDVQRLENTESKTDGAGGEGEQAMIISMVFSSSTLSTYSYTSGGGFSLLAKGAYTGACLTQIRHLSSMQGTDKAVVTTSTDGHIALWRTVINEDGDQVYATEQIVRAHQSSIKCLDMALPIGSGTFYLVTGGDDNAIGVTVLEQTDNNNRDRGSRRFLIKHRGIVRAAHAAAVNSVALAQDGLEGEILAVTVSNDQRVRAWRITESNTAQHRVGLLADEYGGVADAGTVEFLAKGKVAVGGVGLEVWNLNTDPGNYRLRHA